ncbi:MAG: (Fe-S)-binding protein [Myxococcales bacterium]|nr:(Fe-S)-binding protein [Polyangiaceae bacterium]MDW8248504.1 (Fe-S)-binding protein [Myxococcales bacterium]
MTTRSLPLFEDRRAELETCVYCPKLCRAACPVSSAEPKESLTPWGKMSTVYFQARGDAPLDEEHSALAWACTGCHGCRERCDHRNEVASSLWEARFAWFERGLAPAAARRVVARHGALLTELARASADLSPSDPQGTPVLLGCGYVLRLPDVARDALSVARALIGPIRILDRCCGLPLLQAGDMAGFHREIQILTAEFPPPLVLDPGCALALRKAGIHPRLLVEEAVAHLERFSTVGTTGEVRYHDPCQLGRGLGVYEAPRVLLARVLGRAPGEFAERRQQAACSGGGGLLPRTMPEVSRAIARSRVQAHEQAGSGEIVTACASSLRKLREAGAQVSDLTTWLARALQS